MMGVAGTIIPYSETGETLPRSGLSRENKTPLRKVTWNV